MPLDEVAQAREWLQSTLDEVENQPVELQLKLGYVAGLIMKGRRNLNPREIQAWLSYAALTNAATDVKGYASESTVEGVLEAKAAACQLILDTLRQMQSLCTADHLKEMRRRVAVRSSSRTCDATGECSNATSIPPRVRPLFLLGLPRSGTTLLESILGAHRDVLNLGEVRLSEPLSGYIGPSWRTQLLTTSFPTAELSPGQSDGGGVFPTLSAERNTSQPSFPGCSIICWCAEST